MQERENQRGAGTQPVAQCRQRTVRVDERQCPDRVRGVEGLGLGQAADNVSLKELRTFNVRVGGDGAFVLGRGQLDPGDAGSVGLGEMDGVVAGSGTDVQDTAPGDVTKDFGPGPIPSQGVQASWSGMGGV